MMQLQRTNLGSRMSNRAVLNDEQMVSSGTTARPDSSSRLLQVLWERRWVVALCVILAIIGGVIYLIRATPMYASSSRVFVEQSGGPRIMSDTANGVAISNTFLANQIELIRSPAIMAAAAASPAVAASKSFQNNSNPVGTLLMMVGIEVGKQTDILRVTATSADSTEAAAVANAVVNAYVDYQAQKQHSNSAEVLKILEKEKGKQDQALDTISKQMMEFKRDNGVLTFENDKGNIITQRLAELSEALNASDMEVLNARLLKEEVDAVGNDGHKIKQLLQAEFAKGVQINVGADNSEEAQELKKLKSEMAMLRSTYGEKDPKMQEAQRELDSMKQEMEEADQQSVQDNKQVVDQIFDKAQKKNDELKRLYADQKDAALELNGKAAEYFKLESDERRAEKESDLLDSRIKEINVTEDYGSLSINVLETAKPSLTPVSPIAMKVLGEALVAGLMCGLGCAMARDWMDQRLRSVEEIAALMDLSVLGLIPSMPAKASRVHRGQVVQLEPRSPVAESYRTLRTAVYFGTPAGRMKTLLITSPSPADGKSTVSSNLAIAMAQAGERVLLLDADCRRPTQHRIFNLSGRVGMCDILLGHATTEQAIQPSGIANLDLLPCGQLPINPAEVLNSFEFNDLVGNLAAKYDRVILDSPPIMPVTDARILAASCDATILVLRADRSNRKVATHSVDSLRNVGASILGAVVNDVSYKTRRYGYYAGYGYQSHYGPDVPPTSSVAVGLSEVQRNGNGKVLENGKAASVSPAAESPVPNGSTGPNDATAPIGEGPIGEAPIVEAPAAVESESFSEQSS